MRGRTPVAVAVIAFFFFVDNPARRRCRCRAMCPYMVCARLPVRRAQDPRQAQGLRPQGLPRQRPHSAPTLSPQPRYRLTRWQAPRACARAAALARTRQQRLLQAEPVSARHRSRSCPARAALPSRQAGRQPWQRPHPAHPQATGVCSSLRSITVSPNTMPAQTHILPLVSKALAAHRQVHASHTTAVTLRVQALCISSTQGNRWLCMLMLVRSRARACKAASAACATPGRIWRRNLSAARLRQPRQRAHRCARRWRCQRQIWRFCGLARALQAGGRTSPGGLSRSEAQHSHRLPKDGRVNAILGAPALLI